MDDGYSSNFTFDYSDWFGSPASPRVEEALTSLNGVGDVATSFDRDIDTALAEMESMTPAGWDQVLSDPLPFYIPALTAIPSNDDIASSIDTIFDPLSPTSDGTLVDSPSSSSSPLPTYKFGLEDDLVDTFGVPFPSNDFGFIFQSEQYTGSFPDLSGPPIFPTLSHSPDDLGQPQQHEVGAAEAFYGPTLGVQVITDESVFAFTTPPTAQDTLIVVSDIKAENTVAHKNPGTDDFDEEQRTSKRQRRQDTTPRFQCPHCPSKFARTHNLKVHINSKHDGERKHMCTEAECDRAFSRKHDLTRHVQSKHTNLGSPRNKSNPANKVAKAKSAKSRRLKN